MRNRGPQPADRKLFAPRHLPALREATDDLCYLLGRGYSVDSALVLVGNRYRLTARQRAAVGRSAAAPASVAARRNREVSLTDIAGRHVAIDGFNLLILLESAYGGAVVLECRDGTYRDLGSVHGTYKHVQHTLPAIRRVGEALRAAASVTWYLDQPVSNSGRLKTLLRETAEAEGLGWTVELVYNPDRTLIGLGEGAVVVSSDSWILEDGGAWCNVGRALVGGMEGVNLVRV